MKTMTINEPRPFRLLLIAAALSFLPMLNLYYVGEESIFPITSMEMWQRGTWLKQYQYGVDIQHNPLFNWLIIFFTNLFGWPHVLEVARSLTICATLTTAAVLSWLVWRLFHERNFAAFAALTYLTFNDVLLYRDWLARRLSGGSCRTPRRASTISNPFCALAYRCGISSGQSCRSQSITTTQSPRH